MYIHLGSIRTASKGREVTFIELSGIHSIVSVPTSRASCSATDLSSVPKVSYFNVNKAGNDSKWIVGANLPASLEFIGAVRFVADYSGISNLLFLYLLHKFWKLFSEFIVEHI
jgi:hypothetical protein